MNCEQIQPLLLQSLEVPESLTRLQERLLEDHLPQCKLCSEQEEVFFALQTQLTECFSPFALQENNAREKQFLQNLEPFFVQREQQYQWTLRFQKIQRITIAAVILLSCFGIYAYYLFSPSPKINKRQLVHLSPVHSTKDFLHPSTEATLKKVEHFFLEKEEAFLEKRSTQLVAKQKFPDPLYSNPSTIVNRLKPFPRNKLFWEPKRLRGEVIELSENKEWITLNKGEKEYLFEGTEIVLHQKDFQMVVRVSHSSEHQSLCKITLQKHPIQKGCFFFTTILIPQEKFVKNVYVQGKIALLHENQVVIDPLINAEELEIGDLLSVYRGAQKIGVLFVAEAPKFQTGYIVYQSHPFQRGDVVLLEEQPEHFLSSSF